MHTPYRQYSGPLPKGIDARVSAQPHGEGGDIPSPLGGEGEDGGEDVGNDVPQAPPILILAPMLPKGEGRCTGKVEKLI